MAKLGEGLSTHDWLAQYPQVAAVFKNFGWVDVVWRLHPGDFNVGGTIEELERLQKESLRLFRVVQNSQAANGQQVAELHNWLQPDSITPFLVRFNPQHKQVAELQIALVTPGEDATQIDLVTYAGMGEGGFAFQRLILPAPSHWTEAHGGEAFSPDPYAFGLSPETDAACVDMAGRALYYVLPLLNAGDPTNLTGAVDRLAARQNMATLRQR